MYQQVDILHVDDNAADAFILGEALKEVLPNARAFWVSNGEDALAFLRQEGRFADFGRVKVVVLDLNMPGLNGLETLRLIRSYPGMNLLPVVMLSSSKALRDVESAYSAGANAFFSKPSSMNQFVEQIRIVVRHWLCVEELPPAARNGDANVASQN